MQMTVCDRCKEQIVNRNQSEIALSQGGLRLDLCPKCVKELIDWLGDKNVEELNKKTDKEAPELIYCSYSGHDQEAWYKCPYCDEAIGTWELFHSGIKKGQVFTCKKCGKKIKYKDR